MSDISTFIGLHKLSRRTGLAAAWLKREAEAGRLPHIRQSGRLMFNLRSVEQALLERAESNCEPVTAGGAA